MQPYLKVAPHLWFFGGPDNRGINTLCLEDRLSFQVLLFHSCSSTSYHFCSCYSGPTGACYVHILTRKTLSNVMRYELLLSPFYRGRNRVQRNYTTCLRSHAIEWPSKDLNAGGLTWAYITYPLLLLNWQPPTTASKTKNPWGKKPSPLSLYLSVWFYFPQSNFSHHQEGNSSVPLNLCFLTSLCFHNKTAVGITAPI